MKVWGVTIHLTSKTLPFVALLFGAFFGGMVSASGQEIQQPTPPSIAGASMTFASGPTWLLTIPTADTLEAGRYELGLIQGGAIPFHADIGGVWDNLEVGIHGVKLRLLKEDSPWAAFAVGATFGYYPEGAYVVGSKTFNTVRVHLGARFFPFNFNEESSTASGAPDSVAADGDTHTGETGSITSDDRPIIVFGGIEKTIPNLNNARLLLEVGDTLAGGVRFPITSGFNVDVGVRAALPEKLERSLGKRGTVISYTSRETTAYLGLSFSSDFRTPVKTIE